MPKLATWLRAKDEKWFQPFFDRQPSLHVANAALGEVAMTDAAGLLLTGGADISEEFLKQPVPDSSVLEKDADPARDRWEFAALREAMTRGLPIFGICKGLQVMNVALGGTLLLDIRGHDAPEQKNHDVQSLRYDNGASHHFDRVNSSHHQAIDRLGDGVTVEAWCDKDDIIEQVRLRDYPFGLAVQYHPERGQQYDAMFDDFFAHLRTAASK